MRPEATTTRYLGVITHLLGRVSPVHTVHRERVRRVSALPGTCRTVTVVSRVLSSRACCLIFGAGSVRRDDRLYVPFTPLGCALRLRCEDLRVFFLHGCAMLLTLLISGYQEIHMLRDRVLICKIPFVDGRRLLARAEKVLIRYVCGDSTTRRTAAGKKESQRLSPSQLPLTRH